MTGRFFELQATLRDWIDNAPSDSAAMARTQVVLGITNQVAEHMYTILLQPIGSPTGYNAACALQNYVDEMIEIYDGR